jgi:hypothetical protein
MIGVGELDPKRGNVNDCVLDGVLRKDSLPLEKPPTLNQVTGGVTSTGSRPEETVDQHGET